MNSSTRAGTTSCRRLARSGAGDLQQEEDGTPVELTELLADLRRGGRFVVTDGVTGKRCTYAVLAEVLGGRSGLQADVERLLLKGFRPPSVADRPSHG